MVSGIFSMNDLSFNVKAALLKFASIHFWAKALYNSDLHNPSLKAGVIDSQVVTGL